MLDVDPVFTVLTLVALLAVQVFVVRHHVSGLLDPITYFVITSSFALTLTVVYVTDTALIARVFLYFACFWCGFSVVMYRYRVDPTQQVTVHMSGSFRLVIIIGVAFAVLLNVYGWVIFGVPLLSKDPSLQRVEALTGGLGFVRRFNWGMGNFVLVGAVLWYLYARSMRSMACIAALVLVFVLNGSKSAFLPLLFAVGLYLFVPFRDQNNECIDAKIRRWVGPLLVVAVVPVAVVFFIQADDAGSAVVALVTRLLYFGDTMIFWGRDELRFHFSALNSPVDYPAHMLGSLLGMLRLVPYDIPIGNQFVTYTLSAAEEVASSSLGPNTPFYVKGELFFGPWLAPFYALSVGMALAYFRRKLADFQGGSIWSYSMLVTMTIFSMTLPTEDSLFVTRLVDFALFYGIVLLLTRIIDVGARIRHAE